MLRHLSSPLGMIICPSPIPSAPIIVIKELLKNLYSRSRQKALFRIVQNATVSSIQELAREYRCSSSELDAICTRMQQDGVFEADFYLTICSESEWLNYPEVAKSLLKSRLRQYFA